MFSNCFSEETYYQGPWEDHDTSSDPVSLDEASSAPEPIYAIFQHNRYDMNLSVHEYERETGINPQSCTHAAPFPVSFEVSDLPMPPFAHVDWDGLIKQEPIEDFKNPAFLPPKTGACIQKRVSHSDVKEEETFDDDTKSGDDMTDNEDSDYYDVSSSKLSKSNFHVTSSRIRKTRKPLPSSKGTRTKPYTRKYFGDAIKGDLVEQLLLLDAQRCTNADVVDELSKRFPVFAANNEFSAGWVTKARYGQILRSFTGRERQTLRESGLKRARPSKSTLKLREITPELLAKIEETLAEFPSVSAAARHYNVNRSNLRRSLDKKEADRKLSRKIYRNKKDGEKCIEGVILV